MFRGIPLLAVLLLLAAPTAVAQQIRGHVTDLDTGEPLAGALLVVLDADSAIQATTLSDATGAFLLRPTIRDGVRVRVQRIGFATVESVPLTVPRSEPLQLEIRLRPQAIALEGVTATAEMGLNPNLERFLRRRQMGFGRYLGPEEIARIDPKLTSNLLLGMDGSPLKLSGAGRHLLARTRGPSGLQERDKAPGGCIPTVFVDGVELTRDNHDVAPPPWERTDRFRVKNDPLRQKGIRIDSHVPAHMVRAVEVYVRPANAPPEFQRAFMSECPVVVIWTDHGFGFGSLREKARS